MRHDSPTWNGWMSLVAQLRRYYPNDPAHTELRGSSSLAAWSRELFQEVMEQVHGPAWEPARRPTAVRPRRPPRASYVAGARPGGPRGQPGADHRSLREVPNGAPNMVEVAAVLGDEREADVESDGYAEPAPNPYERFEAGDWEDDDGDAYQAILDAASDASEADPDLMREPESQEDVEAIERSSAGSAAANQAETFVSRVHS